MRGVDMMKIINGSWSHSSVHVVFMIVD